MTVGPIRRARSRIEALAESRVAVILAAPFVFVPVAHAVLGMGVVEAATFAAVGSLYLLVADPRRGDG